MSFWQWFFLGLLVVVVGLGVVFRAQLQALMERAGVFFREVKLEMKKVSWPSRQEVIGNTIIVLVTVAVLSVLIGIEDNILMHAVQKLFSAASK